MSISRIDKPWGYEELLEHNEKYVVKRLMMKRGHACSLQYHALKHETIYVLSGKLKIYSGVKVDEIEESIFLPHEVIAIPPLLIHRMEGVEDSIYLESSTPELDDVFRLEDRYNRI